MNLCVKKLSNKKLSGIVSNNKLKFIFIQITKYRKTLKVFEGISSFTFTNYYTLLNATEILNFSLMIFINFYSYYDSGRASNHMQ